MLTWLEAPGSSAASQVGLRHLRRREDGAVIEPEDLQSLRDFRGPAGLSETAKARAKTPSPEAPERDRERQREREQERSELAGAGRSADGLRSLYPFAPMRAA